MDNLEDLKKIIRQFWQEVLETENISDDDDYFNLGGNSLHAYSIVGAINEKCQIDLSIVDIFSHPSIAQLSSHILHITNVN